MAPDIAPWRIAGRSVTLLRLFLVASAAILAVGALVLSARLTGTLREQAVNSEVESATFVANAALSPSIVHGDRLSPITPTLLRTGRAIRLPVDVRSLNAWTRNGTLVFTNVAGQRIGKRLAMDDGLRRFFRTNSAYGQFVDLRKDADERPTANGRPGHDRLLDTYAPIVGASGRTIGAHEVYVDAEATG